MTTTSIHDLERVFISQLQRWQAENDGRPVTRTSEEWRHATGLDEERLTRVRQSLRARGALRVEVVSAWAFRLQGGV